MGESCEEPSSHSRRAAQRLNNATLPNRRIERPAAPARLILSRTTSNREVAEAYWGVATSRLSHFRMVSGRLRAKPHVVAIPKTVATLLAPAKGADFIVNILTPPGKGSTGLDHHESSVRVVAAARNHPSKFGLVSELRGADASRTQKPRERTRRTAMNRANGTGRIGEAACGKAVGGIPTRRSISAGDTGRSRDS